MNINIYLKRSRCKSKRQNTKPKREKLTTDLSVHFLFSGDVFCSNDEEPLRKVRSRLVLDGKLMRVGTGYVKFVTTVFTESPFSHYMYSNRHFWQLK